MADEGKNQERDPDFRSVVRSLIRANREMANALEQVVGEQEDAGEFHPTDFQREILTALKGKALTSNALAVLIGCHKPQLYKDPGGIHELVEEGLVQHQKRLGYYRPDEPPPEIIAPKQAEK